MNNVQGPNEFSKANKMKIYAVLSHFEKRRDSRVKVLQNCPK